MTARQYRTKTYRQCLLSRYTERELVMDIYNQEDHSFATGTQNSGINNSSMQLVQLPITRGHGCNDAAN